MFFSRLAFFSWLASIVAGAVFWVMAGQALVITHIIARGIR